MRLGSARKKALNNNVEKPTWYLFAEEDRMINLKIQLFMADRMGAKVRSDRTGPNLAVDLILEAARETI